MCGRFTQNYTWAEIHAFMSLLGVPRNLRPRYNIAPTTDIDVLRLDKEGKREWSRCAGAWFPSSGKSC